VWQYPTAGGQWKLQGLELSTLTSNCLLAAMARSVFQPLTLSWGSGLSLPQRRDLPSTPYLQTSQWLPLSKLLSARHFTFLPAFIVLWHLLLSALCGPETTIVKVSRDEKDPHYGLNASVAPFPILGFPNLLSYLFSPFLSSSAPASLSANSHLLRIRSGRPYTSSQAGLRVLHNWQALPLFPAFLQSIVLSLS
jgi:hypothetical protein